MCLTQASQCISPIIRQAAVATYVSSPSFRDGSGVVSNCGGGVEGRSEAIILAVEDKCLEYVASL